MTGLREERTEKEQRIELGQFIVADPKICHGKPIYKGTRIMVWNDYAIYGKEVILKLANDLQGQRDGFVPRRVALQSLARAMGSGPPASCERCEIEFLVAADVRRL